MALAMVVACAVLGGCSRVQVGLVVQPDDTVGGDIVVATPAKGPTDTGPPVTIPAELAGDVEVTPYRRQDYTGSRLTFSGLTFAQVSNLTSVAGGAAGSRLKLALRRVGNRVLAEGTADLTTVSADRADFQLKITFPGEVLDSDGEVAAGTVTWTFEPGETGEVRAVARFVDPDGPAAPAWTLALTAAVGAVVGAVVWLARRDRNPPADRSRRPRY